MEIKILTGDKRLTFKESASLNEDLRKLCMKHKCMAMISSGKPPINGPKNRSRIVNIGVDLNYRTIVPKFISNSTTS